MLDRMSLRAAVIGAVVAIVTALTPMAHATEPLVEDRVVALINAQRTDRLVVHYGLLSAARNHSADMAREGGLSHEGADERVNSAPPDPGEFNGAPDDGFGVAAWCENVTYTVGTSESEAPQRIFDQWNRGGAHQRCMMDTTRNVGAVGVYYDGQSWWATFIAEKDATPPGAPATPKPKPAVPADEQKTPRPERTAAPSGDTSSDDDASSARASSEPAPSAVMVIATPAADATRDEDGASREPTDDEAAADVTASPVARELAPERAPVPVIAENAAVPVMPRPGIGWPELAAVVGVLSLATVLLRRSLVRPPPFGPEPVVDDVREPALSR